MMFSKRLTVAAMLAIAVAVSGCASTTAPPQETATEPVPGGTLTWAIDAQPAAGGLDPMVATSIPAAVIMSQAYDTLLTRDESGKILPSLATEWDQPDETTYVFTLRDDVRFADGSAFTADDVVYTFETYKTAQTGKKAYITEVASVQATGEHEVTFTTTTPSSTFLNAVSGPLTMLVVGRDGYGVATPEQRETATFGTGPFQLAEWRDGVSVRMEKNDEYWKDTDRPYIDEIVFEVIPDETTRLAALRQGSVDAAYLRDGALAEQAEESGLMLGDPAYTGVLSFYVNPESGPLSDVRVRQAFSLALDRQALIDTAMFGYGAVSLTVAAGDPGGPVPDERTPNYTRDVEKAKKLLAAAGQREPVVEISYLSDAAVAHHPIYELMQQQLADAGITLKLNPTPLAELSPVWTAGKSWSDLVAIPSSTKTDPVFQLEFLAEDGVLNRWGDDPEAQRALELFADIKVETDATKKAAMLEDLTTEVADKGLQMVPMALPVYFEVWNPEVLHGYQSDPYNARYMLAQSWLTQ